MRVLNSALLRGFAIPYDAEEIPLIIKGLNDDSVVLVDGSHEFFRAYLNSPHAYKKDGTPKTERRLTEELTLVARYRDVPFRRLKEILDAGKAKNIADMVDCSQYESREKFLTQLGQGVAGKTYLVYSPDFKKEMAMKIVHPDFYSPLEVEFLARLDHPNIVRIWYAGKNLVLRRGSLVNHPGEEVFAILMDYVDGVTLREYMKQHPKGVSKEEAIKLSFQLLTAVRYLRRQGVFHRDLNLENIKITSEGNIKVIDFGIATNVQDEPRDNRRYGGPSDLFSWALLTYKIWTGEHLLGEPDMSTRTFAEEIQKLKTHMRNPDGTLKNMYKRKIDALGEGALSLILKSALSVYTTEVPDTLKGHFTPEDLHTGVLWNHFNLAYINLNLTERIARKLEEKDGKSISRWDVSAVVGEVINDPDFGIYFR